MKNNILVVGNGFVGKKLVSYLRTNNYNNSDIGHIYGLKYFNDCDSIPIIESKIKNDNVDYVINCVGYTGTPNVDGCESNKSDTWYLNVVWPTVLASVCARNGARLINISSGCIYSGYEIEYTENTPSDFGLWCDSSSWYSKSKHACELSLQNYDNVYNFRIRMPITASLNEAKNYLTKILKYNNLIDYKNSKTVIDDLLDFVNRFILVDKKSKVPAGNYNVVNPKPLTTKQICDILDDFGYWNPNWKFISLDELYKSTKCTRSNCVLNSDYTTKITGIVLPSEEESIRKILTNEQ